MVTRCVYKPTLMLGKNELQTKEVYSRSLGFSIAEHIYLSYYKYASEVESWEQLGF